MAQDMTRSDLISFINFLGEKGLIGSASAAARKSAVATLLGFLPEEEVSDVTKLDLDDVITKFMNLKGSSFKPASVRVYKSRVESAIRDFAAYKQNPLGFKPKSDQRGPRNTDAKTKASLPDKTNDATNTVVSASSFQVSDNIFPIPLRPNVTVRIAGIPSDLTAAEAKKISNVIAALAAVD